MPTTTIYKEYTEEPHVLRAFFEDKIERDYFFKSKAIEKASSHPNVKMIHNILDRDEATMDQNDPEIANRRGAIKWVNKSTKFLDLYQSE